MHHLITLSDTEGDRVTFFFHNLITIEECRDTNTTNVFILGREYPVCCKGNNEDVMEAICQDLGLMGVVEDCNSSG